MSLEDDLAEALADAESYRALALVAIEVIAHQAQELRAHERRAIRDAEQVRTLLGYAAPNDSFLPADDDDQSSGYCVDEQPDDDHRP